MGADVAFMIVVSSIGRYTNTTSLSRDRLLCDGINVAEVQSTCYADATSSLAGEAMTMTAKVMSWSIRTSWTDADADVISMIVVSSVGTNVAEAYSLALLADATSFP